MKRLLLRVLTALVLLSVTSSVAAVAAEPIWGGGMKPPVQQ